MSIYEKFINYANDLADNKNVISVYKKLVPTFKKAGLYVQEASVLEKIYYINKDYNLYKTIGDIYLEKIGNYSVARIAYNNYFKEKDAEFFYKYIKAFDIDTEDNGDLDNTAVLISDKYCCIGYMIIYCYKRKEYDYVLKLGTYLRTVRSELISYIENNNLDVEEYLNDVKIINELISSELAKIEHHNDINRFAIELNPKNERAYVNVTDDYIEYKNYDNALLFYNNEYREVFDLPELLSIVDVCWHISDRHRGYDNIFLAVKRQQDAVNIELGE